MRLMLLICPNCDTRYVVPDSAISLNGRQVRCAKCRHSWYQEGPGLSRPEASAKTIPAPVDANKHPAPSRAAERDNSRDDLPPPPQFSAMAGVADQDSLPPRPRRNPAKYWTAAAIGFAVLVAAIIGSNIVFGWMGEALPYAEADPPLEIIPNPNPDRQTIMQDGKETEYFAASGTIVNPTDEEQPVPPLLIVLYDAQGRKVYDWVAKPSVTTLAPGGRAEFNDAQLEVPRSAVKMRFFWSE